MFKRLLEVSNSDNLDELAAFLNVNESTLRGRKSRGSVPYDEIVEILNPIDLAYVLKGDRISHDKLDKALNPKINSLEKWELENLQKQVILLRQRIDMLKNPPKVRDGNKFTLVPGAYTDEHYIKALEEEICIHRSKIKELEDELNLSK